MQGGRFVRKMQHQLGRTVIISAFWWDLGFVTLHHGLRNDYMLAEPHEIICLPLAMVQGAKSMCMNRSWTPL